jgi:hypothetical protein
MVSVVLLLSKLMRKDKAESVEVPGWAANHQGHRGSTSMLGPEDLSFRILIHLVDLM